MLEFVHGSIDLNEWRVNFEGGREGKTKACRLRHLTERILYLLLSSIWKRTRMLFTPIFRSTRDLLERCFHPTQQTLEISFHRVRTRGWTPPIIRSSARFRANFRGNASQKFVDPRVSIPFHPLERGYEFRNIFEIFASTQRTDLFLGRANKFLPFRRGSKTIGLNIDSTRAEKKSI